MQGPAKGYIEGLEHRLHDAEQLLLQILPLVSETQLNAVTADIERGGSPGHAGPRVTPPLLNKKTGIDYWEQFPLDSVDSIRRWQLDCAIGARRDSQPRTQVIRRSPSDRGASQPLPADLNSNMSAVRNENSYNDTWSSNYKVEAQINTIAHDNNFGGAPNHHWRGEQPQPWSQPVPQPQQPSNSFFADESQRHVFW